MLALRDCLFDLNKRSERSAVPVGFAYNAL
jgi:hypothetical protein